MHFICEIKNCKVAFMHFLTLSSLFLLDQCSKLVLLPQIEIEITSLYLLPT